MADIAATATAAPPIPGIHHVTAIGSDPAVNRDFYTELLGLRLVKRTVNFDDPRTYHLYYGDGPGSPGTILTFFPWPGARRGQRGTGQTSETAFRVPEGSLGWWADRLDGAGVTREDPFVRLGEEVLTFVDPDGTRLELVAGEGEASVDPWDGGPVPAEHGVAGFAGVTLTLRDAAPSLDLLTDVFRMEVLEEVAEGSGRRLRLAFPGSAPGDRLDVVERPGEGPGRIAAGSVHHVAFRVADDAAQAAWRERLLGAGMGVTDVQDRCYFHSIYFREPGGVLFELATDPPGFGIDEAPEELGTGLRLPPWMEEHRAEIERALPPLE